MNPPSFPYPLVLASFAKGPDLYIPDPQLVRDQYEKMMATGAVVDFPYWARVWPSAHALTLFLDAHPALTFQKKVLELGAGTGLPSFSIATGAFQVIISDKDPLAVALLNENILRMGLTNTSASQLNWMHYPESLAADTILLSDVNYAPEQFGILQQLILRWLGQGSTIVLATPQRLSAISFVEMWTDYIREQQVIDIEEEGRISILVLSKE